MNSHVLSNYHFPTEDVSNYTFLLSLAQMFDSQFQKTTLSEYLWDPEKTETLLLHLRIFDLIRRMHYVCTGKEAAPAKVLAYMEHVMENPRLRKAIIQVAKSGRFPAPSMLLANRKLLGDEELQF